MSLNASGIRDTARGLRISTDTVLSELKKQAVVLESVNTALLRTLNPEQVAVHIEQAGEAEVEEMWLFVGNNGWSAKRSASRKPHRCMTSSLDYSSIDTPLDCVSKMAISTFRTLPHNSVTCYASTGICTRSGR
jgi:hypothetical protein